MNIYRYTSRSWRLLSVLLCLALLAFPQELAATQAETGAADADLVRIDPLETEAGAQAQRPRLQLYETLYTAQGAPVWLAQASLQQQEELAQQGYSVQILDTDAASKEYYLLYDAPQSLAQIPKQAKVILQIEKQALLSLPAGQTLPGSSTLRVQRLAARMMPLPVDNTSPTGPLAAVPMPNVLVQEMISRVDSNLLYSTVGDLSGEWAVNVDGSSYVFETRYTRTDVPIKKATLLVYERLAALGLPVTYDYYLLDGEQKRSVIAEQRGLAHPERILLLTAHLDSYSNNDPYTRAPGADDNASGSAALLAIASILKDYPFDCTLRYALFTGEEQGYFGSQAYAADIYYSGEQLQAVLNLDMLGYNTPGSRPTFELHTRPGNGNDYAIADLFAQAVGAYGINLVPQIVDDGLSFSDHSPFWNYGYPALLAIEDWNDHTPYYHTTNDQLENLNLPYYTDAVKAALATFAHMGCLVVSGELNGTVRDAVSTLPLAGASVEIWQGNESIQTIETAQDGRFQASLGPGTYRVEISAPDHLDSVTPDIEIVPGQPLEMNVALQPCVFVKNAGFSHQPIWPNPNETITFTASLEAGESPVTYLWNFGDGFQSTGEIITHTFSMTGTYAVRMEANNICAIPSSVTKNLYLAVERIHLPFIAFQTPNP